MEEIINSIIKVAASKSYVTKVYLFGSRVKGAERPGSDLDIAVEFEWQKGMGVGPLSSMWGAVKEDLLPAIQRVSPYEIDLQWFEGKEDSPTIYAGLKEASVVFRILCHFDKLSQKGMTHEKQDQLRYGHRYPGAA